MKSTGVIFRRALWDARLGILGWGLGLGALAMTEMMLYPAIQQAFSGIGDLLENPLYRALLGEIADAAAFATPAGYVAIYMVAFVPVYLAVYAVLLGLEVFSNDEERGRLDLLLGTPIQRWQLVIEKFAAVVVILVLVLALNSVGAAVGILLTSELSELSIWRLVEATVAMLPITLLMASMTLLFTALLRSRMLAIALTGAIIIASFFVNNLASVAQDALGVVRYTSFFAYFSPLDIMRNGVIWGEFLFLLALALALCGLAIVALERRDLAV